MTTTTKTAADHASADLNTLKEDLATLRTDLSELTESLIETGKHKAKKTYNNSVENINDFVHEKPLTALGAAFGVGVLVSILFSRR